MNPLRRFLVALPLALSLVCGAGASLAFAQVTCTDQTVAPAGTQCVPCPGGGTSASAYLCPEAEGGPVCTDGSDAPAGSQCVPCPGGGTSASALTCPSTSSATNAATPAQTSGTALLNPLQATSLTQLLQEILAYVVLLGGIFLTIMLIYVGYLFVSARGNSEKISQARQALLWVVIGGILLLGAQALATVITTTVASLSV